MGLSRLPLPDDEGGWLVTSGDVAVLSGEIVGPDPIPAELAQIANREHALVGEKLGSMVEHAIRAGEALAAVKAQLAHGEWLPWLAENFAGSERMAHRYMRIAANPTRVSDLPEPSLRKALAAIAGREVKGPDDEWYTPGWLFDSLGLTFSIDVCAPAEDSHTAVPAQTSFTILDDGLEQKWTGTIWCNPPYSEPAPWAERCIEHGDGLLLTHIPMNAEWCSRVWDACAGIRLFQGIEFVRPDGSLHRPGYWLQLAAFGSTAGAALARLEAPPEVAINPRRVPSPMWRAAA